MSNRQQIGPGGLALLMIGFLLGSTLLLPMGAPAQQAAWLSTLIGGFAGVAVNYTYAKLSVQFPGHSLIGYHRAILGRWVGSLTSLLYLWYGFHLGSLVLRNFGEFLLTTILPTTPLSVVILTLVMLSAYAVRTGIEPLTRSAQVLVLVVLALVALALVLLAKEARLENLQPWLSDQPQTILPAGLAVLSFPFGETVLFSMVLPHVKPVKSIPRTVILTVFTGALTLTMIAALSTAVLGPHIRGASPFSTLSMIRQIALADFSTTLDVLMVGAWIFTGFIKVSVCLYFCATGLAEWLNLREYRPLVWPLAALMMGMSINVYGNVSAMTAFLNIWAIYSIPFQVLIPLSLLALAAWQGTAAEEPRPEKGG